MSDILCIYYSRTGHTKQAMEEVAQALGAETVELRDGANRSGWPGWAGRCSSVVRSFLKEHGGSLRNAAYVITRGSEDKNEEVYEQMDQYTPCGHYAAVSLRTGSVGYAFWEEEFLRQVRELLSQQ